MPLVFSSRYHGTFVLFFILTLICFVKSVYGEKIAYKAVTNDDGVQVVEIIGDSYYFSPNHIIIKVDLPVELKVRKKSRSIVPHNVVIKAPAGIKFSTKISIKPTIIKFTPTQIGKYVFYCDKKLLFFKSHKERGMEGTFEVVK